jgi:hypothetical protein
MQLRVKLAAGVAALGIAGVSTAAIAHDRSRFQAGLNGYEELPTLSTQGVGSLEASLSRDGNELRYRLSYRGPFDGNPTGTASTVLQAHIHVGARAVNGGVSAFLCTNLGNGPIGTPTCPLMEGTVTGVITPATVVGPANQGIAAGEFNELVRAIRAGATYANIHTTANAGGEIRGQISTHDEGRDH